MTQKIRTMISLDEQTDGLVRELAAAHRTRISTVVRALLQVGLHADGQQISTAIRDEIDDDKAQRAQIGREAMQQRWGTRED